MKDSDKDRIALFSAWVIGCAAVMFIFGQMRGCSEASVVNHLNKCQGKLETLTK